jgi:DEAD/DEAH box helicase domain-containing protein
MKALHALKADRETARNIALEYTFAAQEARTAPLPQKLHPAVKKLVQAMGIEQLYQHQHDAIIQALAGKHCIVTSGVASGKSLCYQLPVLHQLAQDAKSRALLLFPTKALTQDQDAAMVKLLNHPAWEGPKTAVGIYDGDTPASMRQTIRAQASIILANPDMLHLGILPHHTAWKDFFSNLRYVVIDEVHVYRGVFGSHVGNVLRRLKRICRFYGSSPQFILTSATMGGVRDFTDALLETPVQCITESGAPRGAQHLLLYNPPIVNAELGIRRSALKETVRLVRILHKAGIQTLVFAPSRRMVELIVTYLQSSIADYKSIYGYRSGYLPTTRRRIEQQLKSGELRTVVSTNALELGIDVGGIDAVVICGYPGSIASFRQQSGRAGRTLRPSLAMMVASSNLLDQYIIDHPEYLIESAVEEPLVNPDNPFILLPHIKCALFEKPFATRESFGKLPPDILGQYIDILRNYDLVHSTKDRHFWKDSEYPAQKISLRTTGAGDYLLRLDGTTIGIVDEASAFWMTHPQAIYIHEGESYLVSELNSETHEVTLQAQKTDYYTQALSISEYMLYKQHLSKDAITYHCHLGQMMVTTQVTGFKKMRWHTNEILGYGTVDLPPTDMVTFGMWLVLSDDTVTALEDEGKWRSANDYGPDWKTLTETIKARDNHSCRHCGVHEKFLRGGLHVHHKVPFKQFSDPAAANDPENLVTLCPACHRAAEQNYRVQSGLAGLAYLLRNIAPFHLMSDSNDIRVHAEHQLSLADGKPGIVIYDAFPGGMGLSENIYHAIPRLLQEALNVIRLCPCEDGCPACTGPVADEGSGAKHLTRACIEELL